MPTMPGTLRVPDRSPRSWPPPCTIGSQRTRGSRRRTKSRPTPFGPWILWALALSRSMCMAFTSMRSLPYDCVASVWNRTPRSRHSAPMRAMGCSTPVSLLACMTDTSRVCSVTASASRSRSSRPSPSTPTYVTAIPRPSRRSHVSRTARCSVVTVTTCRFFAYAGAPATPSRARLSDSVAPLVHTISRGSAPMTDAARPRAFSTAVAASQPRA